MARNKEEYDWLEDPFDEKKQAEERELMQTSGGTKRAFGCLIAIVLLVILCLVFAVMILS